MQSKINSDRICSSKIWAFFIRENSHRKGFGETWFCVLQSCGVSETVKRITGSFASFCRMFLMLERLYYICFQTALSENTFSDAFCMISHNFPERTALEEELCDMLECICNAMRQCCA